MGAFGAGPRGHRARFPEMGRPAGVAAAIRRIGGARLQDRDDAALRAGAAVARRRAAGEPDPRGRQAAHPQAAAQPPPRRPRGAAPRGDSGAVAEAATLLVGAEAPVLIADRLARTQAGME